MPLSFSVIARTHRCYWHGNPASRWFSLPTICLLPYGFEMMQHDRSHSHNAQGARTQGPATEPWREAQLQTLIFQGMNDATPSKEHAGIRGCPSAACQQVSQLLQRLLGGRGRSMSWLQILLLLIRALHYRGSIRFTPLECSKPSWRLFEQLLTDGYINLMSKQDNVW